MNTDVLILDALPAEVVDALHADFTVHRLGHAPDGTALPAEVLQRIRGVITTWDKGFSSDVLALLPRLEVISVWGTGHEHLDLQAAQERGIVVTNTAADGTDACVADMAMAFALALARRMIDADRFVRSGSWLAERFPLTTHIGRKKAGIVGLGFIGRQIAKRAEAFGMTVVYNGIEPVVGVAYDYVRDLEEMASAVDFLFVSCRGEHDADGMISSGVLDALGSRGYLIHIAQARFYDEQALISALRTRAIAGAAIDMFPNQPEVNPELLKLDNVILSPHIGASTHEVLIRRAELTVSNLKMFFANGSPESRLV